MEEIIQAVAFEAQRRRALAMLEDIGCWNSCQASLLEAAAEQLQKIQNEKTNGPEPGQEALK